jgi:hypothetical protein
MTPFPAARVSFNAFTADYVNLLDFRLKKIIP